MKSAKNREAPTSAASCPVERAQQLADSRPQAGQTHLWHHEALQFGDLSVLAAHYLRR